MKQWIKECVRLVGFTALIVQTAEVFAAPTNVSVTPPQGARFLTGQKFDIRVEGQGTGPYTASLEVDGVPVDFTSGVQGTTDTDGITTAGWGGFNLRGYSFSTPGAHNLAAAFSDSNGTTNASARIQVIDAFGKQKPVKNIIIMLGDGMGVAHRTAARLVKYGVTAGQPNGYLAMDQLPGTGLVTTHSLNSIITDSAPGMACYSSGNHTNNGQEGVYPAHMTNVYYQPRIEYMAEYLHRVRGSRLGVVSNADLEDATPAANAIHTGNRNLGTGICDQYLDEGDASNTGLYGTGLSVLLGGGRRWFLPAGQFGSSRAAASDYDNLPADILATWNLPDSASGRIDPERDLIQDFIDSGFAYADSATTLADILSQGTPDKLLGLFGYGNMNVTMDRIAKRRGVLLPGTDSFAVDDYHAPDQPMLEEMTDAALQILSTKPNGFVLMVEGAHIDKQSHLMDADRVIDETIEFDNAIGVARRFADQVDGTMVIVLADHECSGFSLIGALTGGIKNLQNLPSDSDNFDPLVAPRRQGVVGTYDAAGFPRYTMAKDGYPESFDIDGKLLIGYGANADRWEGWLSKPRPVIDSLLPSDVAAELVALGYPGRPFERSENQQGFYIRGQADGRGGAQAVHTASDIPVSAYSSGSDAHHQFHGVQTNTDVFFKLMRAALGGY
ncbi:MAG TPA: alkaline phosphatase [Myxococcaceae bacterium]|nr:alkaline phosphatase [Myxococcaceae bacterium]